MKYSTYAKLFYSIPLFLITALLVLSCNNPKPQIQPMTITLKMPSSTTTSNTSFAFPSDLMGSIQIDVNANNFKATKLSGDYSFSCIGISNNCPKNTSFKIDVPSTGDFTLRVLARTRTCSSLILPSCKSEMSNDVGSLLTYEWNFKIYNGTVTNGGSYQLLGNVLGQSGQPTLTAKCCCANTISGLKCGQQSNGTSFVSCVPASFESANNYTGVCGASDLDGFSCPGAEDVIDQTTTNCGKPCGPGLPCTENGYNCSISNLQSSGICQFPCKYDAQCPSGLGCNTGWCR